MGQNCAKYQDSWSRQNDPTISLIHKRRYESRGKALARYRRDHSTRNSDRKNQELNCNSTEEDECMSHQSLSRDSDFTFGYSTNLPTEVDTENEPFTLSNSTSDLVSDKYESIEHVDEIIYIFNNDSEADQILKKEIQQAQDCYFSTTPQPMRREEERERENNEPPSKLRALVPFQDQVKKSIAGIFDKIERKFSNGRIYDEKKHRISHMPPDLFYKQQRRNQRKVSELPKNQFPYPSYSPKRYTQQLELDIV